MPVAVLIVGYRAYDALERCLVSLAPVLGPGDEVVIVDHESDEAELARVAALCPRAFAIARADNPGFAAGVNRAARHSRAPYLLVLNPDVELLGPVPAVLGAWLDAHADVAVAGPRVLNADGSLQPSARRFPDLTTVLGGRTSWLSQRFPGNAFTARNWTSRGATTPMDVDWISGACLMTRRDVFEAAGGFDESFFLYCEDIDYCRRLAASGWRRAFVPTVTVRHQGGASARHNLECAIRQFHVSAYRCYWKHSRAVGRAFAPFVRAGLYLRGELRLRRALRESAPARPPAPIVSAGRAGRRAPAPASSPRPVKPGTRS